MSVVLCAVDAFDAGRLGATGHAYLLARRSLRIAERRGDELELVCAYDPDATVEGAPHVSRRELTLDAMADLVSMLPEPVSSHVAPGDVVEVVSARAEEVDASLLVIGRSRAPAWRRLFAGSVFDELIDATSRPIRVEPVPEISTPAVLAGVRRAAS